MTSRRNASIFVGVIDAMKALNEALVGSPSMHKRKQGHLDYLVRQERRRVVRGAHSLPTKRNKSK